MESRWRSCMHRAVIVVFSVCVAGLLISGCSAGADVARVEGEIAGFRQLVIADKFHEIYSASANDLRNTTSEKDFTDLLSAVKRKLGPLQSSQQLNWQTMSVNGNSTIKIVFKSQYTGGDATEQFTYKFDGQSYLLAGYNINSNALIIK